MQLNKANLPNILFFILAVLSFTPWISPPVALVLGIVFVNFVGEPMAQTGAYTKRILQYSIIGLGFGINYNEALAAGKDGFMLTVMTIVLVLIAGMLLGKVLGIDKTISRLISVGTAICGGSAIAAVSPILRADNRQNSISLGIVFVLNAMALLLFPWIGKLLELTQNQFGIWSAIAIHDTSSVVGAASNYGLEALQVATTVKLARALWIIPIALLYAVIARSETKIKFPYFIIWFVVAILVNSFLPGIEEISAIVSDISRAMLKVALFLIGTGLSVKVFREIGFKPFFAGFTLWLFISATSLLFILYTIQ
ncbi:MAG: putative sulfate exporter family transporter [Weeksellaceae bacterium]|nr:putative sulfate exporter family transporter [Weeksellaceae bacterium]